MHATPHPSVIVVVARPYDWYCSCINDPCAVALRARVDGLESVGAGNTASIDALKAKDSSVSGAPGALPPA